MSIPLKPLPDGYLSPRLLSIRLSIGRRTLWRMVQRGQLPQPVRFTRKLVRWRWGVVLAHLKAFQDRQRLLAEDAEDARIVAEVDAAFAADAACADAAV